VLVIRARLAILLIKSTNLLMKYLLPFLFTLFLLACKKNNSGTGNNNGYDPNKPSFKAGTAWTYHYTSYQPNGTVSSEDDISLTIAKDTMINGAKYFVTSSNYYFTNKADGYYEYDRNTKEEHFIYKLNSTAVYQGSYLSIPPSTCILAFNAQVTNSDTTHTAYGTSYDKLVYYTLNNYSTNCQFLPTHSKDLYSSKVGLRILSQFYSGNPAALSQRIELKSFTY
jgi:hypothetical protein